jgi:aminodeoxyfutalosine deaminase
LIMAISLQARVVFPVDRPPLEHGVVTIDGERIIELGTKSDARETIDLGSVALLPGLVNAHTHLEFSRLRRPLGAAGIPLVDWIRLVIAERARGDYSRADSIAAGLRESHRCGVTTIGEIAAGEMNTYHAADVTAFVEVIGFSRARAASALLAASERLAEFERAGRSVQIGISPHAPYTVSLELLSELVGLARKRQMPVAMHLAESADELELLRSGTGRFQELLDERSMWDDGAIPRGSRPFDYLKVLAEAPRSAIIHGNFLGEDEWAFLAARSERMSLIYCPRTHEYFAHPPYPLSQLLEAGVNVAAGTDSRASNPDLNMLPELRAAARLHPNVSPNAILQMGTLGGACALDRANDVGSITPGKIANLVAVPVREEDGSTPSDLLTALLADEAPPCAVWLRGDKVH